VSAWLALLAWALAAQALHLRGRHRLVLAARAGHEVRGPLCTAQLALDGLEPSARVEAIGLELQRAALALDDLTGSPRRDAVALVDVSQLLSDAAPAWNAFAAAHDVTVVVDPGEGCVIGDRLRLAQACGNLVANAIEHGGALELAGDHPPRLFGARDESRLFDYEGDQRTVRVSASRVGGRIRIEVRDRGPGLPAPVAGLVAAARGRRSPRGHGLAIAAAVAERHGGRLASLPAARGAHLVLELPAAP
jgi:signal transduction histidine kinase